MCYSRRMQTKEIKVRNVGTKSEYYTLTVKDKDGKIVRVHTSKDYSYICRLSH